MKIRTPLLISPSLVGETNRARVLQALYDHGPQTRAVLARRTGVTRATIGTIVQPMLDDGLLVEGDRLPSSSAGGKPSRPLWFSSTTRPIVGAHLLPGRIETALVSVEGTILATAIETFRATTHDTGTVLDRLASCLEQVRTAATSEVRGVGIAVGGMVDSDAGVIVEMNLAPGLAGFKVGPLVAERLGVPTYVDHHPRVQALGDRWFGVGRGTSSFASVYTGEALGVGLVIGGRVHSGPAGAGGEAGHSFLQLDGELCRCGQRGCWETVAAYGWLRRQATELGLPGASSMDALKLVRLSTRNQAAAGLLDQYARNLATGMANLQQVFAPGLFILHGDAVLGGEPFRSAIEQWLCRLIPSHPSGPPRVVFTDLDDRATLLGTAGLVLANSLLLKV